LHRDTLANAEGLAGFMATLDANRAISDALSFALTQADFRQLAQSQKVGIEQMSRQGASFSLANAASLRFDFGELQGLGFTSVRIDATRFLRHPDTFTDFHPADVAAYAKRFGMEVIA